MGVLDSVSAEIGSDDNISLVAVSAHPDGSVDFSWEVEGSTRQSTRLLTADDPVNAIRTVEDLAGMLDIAAERPIDRSGDYIARVTAAPEQIRFEYAMQWWFTAPGDPAGTVHCLDDRRLERFVAGEVAAG
jgi:hypothetical protein